MKKKWVQNVKTDSTFPPEGTFSRDKSAEEIAAMMSRPDVSPKGIGSAIKMIQYFINRGGSKIDSAWKSRLEKAKQILQKKK